MSNVFRPGFGQVRRPVQLTPQERQLVTDLARMAPQLANKQLDPRQAQFLQGVVAARALPGASPRVNAMVDQSVNLTTAICVGGLITCLATCLKILGCCKEEDDDKKDELFGRWR